MRFLLLLLSIGLWLVQDASAQTYSCRDNQGRLHFSDNLTRLPPECQAEAKELKPRSTENLNFVPAAPAPAVRSGEVERQVREVERKAQQKKRQAEQLERRAQGLVSQYRDAFKDRHDAQKRWNYASREKVQQAEEEIQQARAGKQQLLEELPRARIATAEKQRIRALLGQIADP